MIRATILTMFVAFTLVACDEGPPPAPIVVYAIGDDEPAITELLAEFTEDTRITVTLVFSKSSRNADLVINNNGSPPADVLITNSVADIWRAADEGALMPITASTIARADPLLSDPDGFWTALAVRTHVIATSKDVTTSGSMPAGYDWLAGDDMRGRVCLSSSALHANRSLIATLMDERGAKQVERLVRAWIRNLAAPPFSSESELLSAIRDGTCDYGILSHHPHVDDLLYIVPLQQTMDIDGVGVARHARQTDSAQRLVEWIVRERQPRIDSNSAMSPVSVAGWLDEDARLLAERAGYQ
jgi:iron(III) transport system substrate-binding protein